MEKTLYLKEVQNKTVVIQHDDLKYDGKNIIIPSYYVDNLIDYIKNVDVSQLPEAEIEDFEAFRAFLLDVQDSQNSRN